jgi:hypothetical protein
MSAAELERDLAALAAEVDWPETPQLHVQVEGRPRRSRRRLLALGVALALLAALGAALAVPSSRGAILRFFHLQGATVELVDTLPTADERPLTAGLGPALPRVEAERAVGFRMLLPADVGDVGVHVQPHVASVVLDVGGEPVLLSELASREGGAFIKKVAGSATRVEWVNPGGFTGIWIGGRQHVFSIPPETPARLAGNVLLWQRGPLTLRLEGAHLTKARALEVARSLR